MDFRDGAIDQDVFKVRRVSQGMEKLLPHPRVRPTPEPRMHCGPFAEHLRQITPAGRIAGHPQDRINKQPVVDPAPPRRANTARQVPFNTTPLFVGQCPVVLRLDSLSLELEFLNKGNPECRQDRDDVIRPQMAGLGGFRRF